MKSSAMPKDTLGNHTLPFLAHVRLTGVYNHVVIVQTKMVWITLRVSKMC